MRIHRKRIDLRGPRFFHSTKANGLMPERCVDNSLRQSETDVSLQTIWLAICDTVSIDSFIGLRQATVRMTGYLHLPFDVKQVLTARLDQ
jgi:hypothetical protein